MASSKSPVGRDRGRQPGGPGQQPRPGLLPARAGRPSSTWSSTTSPSGPASSTRCASGRACCTGSPRGWPARRCTRSGCRPARRDWVETVQLYFPRWGRTADELCVTELGSVIWAVQMSTVEFHPWNSRRADTEKPDEWRIDLDPGDECDYATVRRVAHVAHEVLDELGAVGFPKTTGGKGLHVYVRIHPEHGFKDVRRAALAFAREVERRTPGRRHHHLVAQGPRPAQALRRLQPERPRPHHRRGVLGARPARRPGLHADPLGRGRRRRPARLHDLHGARPVRRKGDLHETSTSTLRHPPLLEWAERDEAEGRRRRTSRGGRLTARRIDPWRRRPQKLGRSPSTGRRGSPAHD